MTDLATIEARRAERKAELARQRDAQRAIDLEALDALEVEHGDSNVGSLDVPFSPGLPTLAAVRTPNAAEIKRYRARIKGDTGNAAEAATELAGVAVVYPPKGEVRDALFAARPALSTQLGTLAVTLAMGSEAERGKE